MIERLNREIRRRTRVAGVFSSGQACARLAAMHLMEHSEKWSLCRQRHFTPQEIESPLAADIVWWRWALFRNL